ncbi:AMP-binding protein [Deltaproteobacteria bacterium TL4]
MEDVGNFVQAIIHHCRHQPEKMALIIPKSWDDNQVTEETCITYGELYKKIAGYVEGLKRAGFKPGDRILILFPPSIELYAFWTAVMASGVVAVFVDMGMGLKKAYQAITDSKVKAVVSMHAFLKYRFILPTLWKCRLFSVDSKGLLIHPFEELFVPEAPSFKVQPRNKQDHCLITFTSGSTGRPKGADRPHSILIAQDQALWQSAVRIDPGWEKRDYVCLTCFPVALFFLLSPGLTVILPAMDFKKPGEANPKLIVQQFLKWNIHCLSAAPAFMDRFISYLEKENLPFPGVKSIITGGAPVSRTLCQRIVTCFPNASNEIAYGSTEAEPVAHVDMKEVAAESGKGYLVGKPVKEAEVEIVKLPKGLIKVDEQQMNPFRVKQGEIGEIVVKGNHVLQGYIDNEQADREHKIKSPVGGVWHRMGDTGYFDTLGRIWLVGRASAVVYHQGQPIHPFLIEQHVNELKGIVRSALVSKGKNVVLVLQLEKNVSLEHLKKQIRSLEIIDNGIEIISTENIPVDRRHNSKVDRPKLKKIMEA